MEASEYSRKSTGLAVATARLTWPTTNYLCDFGESLNLSGPQGSDTYLE